MSEDTIINPRDTGCEGLDRIQL